MIRFGRKLVRLRPDKVRGVDLESKWGQERAIRGQKPTNIKKTVTKKWQKLQVKDNGFSYISADIRCSLFRGRDICKIAPARSCCKPGEAAATTWCSYMAIYGHIWVIYGHIWAIYIHIWTIYGHIWTIYSHIWSYMAIYGPYMAIYGPYMAIYVHIWPYMAHIWPYMDHIWPYMDHILSYMDHRWPYMAHIYYTLLSAIFHWAAPSRVASCTRVEFGR